MSTGGGDAPGLNAVIRAVVLAGRNRGWDVVGIRDGFNGLMFPERYRDGGVVPLPREVVRGIVHLGGTILGTTNRGSPIAFPVRQPDGSYVEVDRTDEIVKLFAARRRRTFGDDDDRELRAALLALGDRRRDRFERVRDLGDEDHVDRACEPA